MGQAAICRPPGVWLAPIEIAIASMTLAPMKRVDLLWRSPSWERSHEAIMGTRGLWRSGQEVSAESVIGPG